MNGIFETIKTKQSTKTRRPFGRIACRLKVYKKEVSAKVVVLIDGTCHTNPMRRTQSVCPAVPKI
jgi:hypothetical protein